MDLRLCPRVQVLYSTGVVHVPYAQERDGRIYQYQSLVNEPEAIDQLPELDGEPAMKELVRQINSPSSLFETIRIDKSLTTLGADEMEKAFYVGFMFRNRRRFGNYQNCGTVAGCLLEYLYLLKQRAAGYSHVQPYPESQAPILVFERTELIADKDNGWSMTLYLNARGKSADEARIGLDERIKSVTPFFSSYLQSLAAAPC